MQIFKTLLMVGAAVAGAIYLTNLTSGRDPPAPTPTVSQAVAEQPISDTEKKNMEALMERAREPLKLKVYIYGIGPKMDAWLSSMKDTSECGRSTQVQCVMALDRVRIASQDLLQYMEKSDYPECIKGSQQILATALRTEIEVADEASLALQSGNLLGVEQAATQQLTVSLAIREATAQLNREKNGC